MKKLPYFKFITSEWLTGDILFEDLETQGLFINICALYWHREGVLSVEDINKRFQKPNAFNSLCSRFISVNENNLISIKFLNEQFIELGHISETNSKNGKKGGRPKGSTNKDKKPTALIPLSEPEAKKSNKEIEEDKEGEKNKKNTLIDFEVFWKIYPNKTGKAESNKKWDKLKPVEQEAILEFIPNWLKHKPFEGYNYPMATTFLNQRRWEDELVTKPTEQKQSETPTYKSVSQIMAEEEIKLQQIRDRRNGQ